MYVIHMILQFHLIRYDTEWCKYNNALYIDRRKEIWYAIIYASDQFLPSQSVYLSPGIC